ncbi:MAG: IS5 family transposase ISBam3 [Burkholderia gladioli]|nr:MAG: IS5 family transposase ISBam3 [Burkholderia gladioli]
MCKDIHKTGEPKARYRVRNWAAYNDEGLINRGNVTIWIDEAVLARIPDAILTRGRPCLYGDTLIQTLLGVKTVYRLTLRALQGFTKSLRDLAFPSLPVSNYTTLCRREKTLDVELPILCDNEPIHLVVDSTGLKVYGEGEWKVRQHGYSKQRTWRKVHLAHNANTGQVHAALMTHQNVAEGDALAKLLDQIPREEQIDVIGGDGAYETKPCHAAIAARSAIPSIPPHEGAAHWPADMPRAAWRNGAVDAIARDGRREWKQDSGYHRRSLAENAIYRFKTLTGNCLWARHIASQATEVSIRASASSTVWRTSLVRNPFV